MLFRSVIYLQKAIEICPANTPAADIYNNRGLAYAGKGDFQRALLDFDQANELDPSYAKAYNNRGILHVKNNDYDRAICDFDKALELDPGYAQARRNRAVAYKKKGDAEPSIETSTKRSN